MPIENYGDKESLLRMIQERSEDITRAVIFPPGYGYSQGGQRIGPIPGFGMAIYFTDKTAILTEAQTLMVLNDGILSRMKIQIEFLHGSLDLDSPKEA